MGSSPRFNFGWIKSVIGLRKLDLQIRVANWPTGNRDATVSIPEACIEQVI